MEIKASPLAPRQYPPAGRSMPPVHLISESLGRHCFQDRDKSTVLLYESNLIDYKNPAVRRKRLAVYRRPEMPGAMQEHEVVAIVCDEDGSPLHAC